jgi:hypothetical protein
MKDPYMITSMLIPGPKAPGNDIDVYLQPLIDELIELWGGVEAYDASAKCKFTLKAALLWTINDYQECPQRENMHVHPVILTLATNG